MGFIQGLNTELCYSVLSEVSRRVSSTKCEGICENQQMLLWRTKTSFQNQIIFNSIANVGLLGLAFVSSSYHFQTERILWKAFDQSASTLTLTSLRTLFSLISLWFPDTPYWALKRCLGLISHIHSNIHHSQCTWLVKGLKFWIFSEVMQFRHKFPGRSEDIIMCYFLRRQDLFRKAPQDIRWLKSTLMPLNEYLLQIFFFPWLFCIFPWANYGTDFPLPEQMIVYKQGHSFRTQKPHAHLQQSKQRLKLASSTSQHSLNLSQY